jgi:hypothetical protein
VVGGAALVTAAVVVAVGFLIASDVRGRAAASVAIVEARAALAETMIRAAQSAYEPAPMSSPAQIIPLSNHIPVKYLAKGGSDEEGWLAVAMERGSDGGLKYIVVKESSEVRATASELEFPRYVAIP